MNATPFGTRSGLDASPISIGAMRLPGDTEDAVALIRQAIDAGMRYIDTSRGYGQSEWLLGRALRDGYREKVILSTKWSSWITKIRDTDDQSASSFRRRLEESMARLDVDYLDFYQIWNIHDPKQFQTATAPDGALEALLQAKEEGLIRHLGFTMHDAPEHCIQHMEQAPWCDAILVTYNLMHRLYAPVLEKAKELGIASIVMNPMGGGRFAQESPVLSALAAKVGVGSPAELATRFVMSNPNIDTQLCGIAKPSDITDTVAAADLGPLTADQLAIVDAFYNDICEKRQGFCTSCGYCAPCPQGINIPEVMKTLFNMRVLGTGGGSTNMYDHFEALNAGSCTSCGACETKCTQSLTIIKEMKEAAEMKA